MSWLIELNYLFVYVEQQAPDILPKVWHRSKVAIETIYHRLESKLGAINPHTLVVLFNNT